MNGVKKIENRDGKVGRKCGTTSEAWIVGRLIDGKVQLVLRSLFGQCSTSTFKPPNQRPPQHFSNLAFCSFFHIFAQCFLLFQLFIYKYSNNSFINLQTPQTTTLVSSVFETTHKTQTFSFFCDLLKPLRATTMSSFKSKYQGEYSFMLSVFNASSSSLIGCYFWVCGFYDKNLIFRFLVGRGGKADWTRRGSTRLTRLFRRDGWGSQPTNPFWPAPYNLLKKRDRAGWPVGPVLKKQKNLSLV